MNVRRLKVLALAITAAAAAASAHAADYSPPPPPVYIPPQPVVEEFAAGWYLRGDIGFSNQRVDRLSNPSSVFPLLSSNYEFDSAPIYGIGVGYYFNDWLRFDLTGEYRGGASFHGHEVYTTGTEFTDEYTGIKSEWLFLANAYVDLGTWYSVTPFVGVGVGFSRNTISAFQDACHNCGGNVGFTGISFAEEKSKWNFAWALHAGLSYKVSKNLSVELAYRYLDLGDAETGSLVAFDGSQTLSGSTFEHITSHDIRLGLRFNLDGLFAPSFISSSPAPATQYYASTQPVYSQPAPAPVYAAPQQTYTYSQPAPVYAQPAPVYAQPAPVYAQPAPLYAPRR